MPQVFWNAGCQLVALNFQTIGKTVLYVFLGVLCCRHLENIFGVDSCHSTGCASRRLKWIASSVAADGVVASQWGHKLKIKCLREQRGFKIDFLGVYRPLLASVLHNAVLMVLAYANEQDWLRDLLFIEYGLMSLCRGIVRYSAPSDKNITAPWPQNPSPEHSDKSNH